MPRYALAEWNTHRLMSRNAASSRAIPVAKLRELCMHRPVTPFIWGKNQKGMQSFETLDEEAQQVAMELWHGGAQMMAELAEKLEALGLHKQWANRPMEAFLPVKVIFTATDLGNLFNLRAHAMALPDFGQLTYLLLDRVHKTPAQQLNWGEWHIPLGDRMPEIDSAIEADAMRMLQSSEAAPDGLYLSTHAQAGQWPEFMRLLLQLKIATARCARISYLNYDGIFKITDDFRIHDDLARSGHWSPFEHCAMAEPAEPPAFQELKDWIHTSFPQEQSNDLAQRFIEPLLGKVKEDHGNFRGGWKQYRKFFPREHQWAYDYDALMANKPDWIQLDEI